VTESVRNISVLTVSTVSRSRQLSEEIVTSAVCDVLCTVAVSLAFVNSSSYVAHHGGKRKLYGTNPMAFGFPRAEASTSEGGDPGPLVWDQASAAMARGEIQLHQREGKELPAGAAIDANGEPTTSPDEALAGAQLPFGGHKGAAIAMMVELLAAGLTGSALSFETDDPTWNGPSKHGEMIILIDPKVRYENGGAFGPVFQTLI
jgi:delta1-piperideine-2-carboxylate reductase